MLLGREPLTVAQDAMLSGGIAAYKHFFYVPKESGN
jgi:hypothetical protein